MKILLGTLAALVFASSALADEASHKALASKILDLNDTKVAMRTGFMSVIEPMIAGMKQRGMPENAATEMRQAVLEWFDTEIKWEEMKPKVVDLYVKEFTEKELQDLVAFYETPTGRKAVTRLPQIMQQGAQIGQEYFVQKQESLSRKIQPIMDKYRPKNP